MWGINQYRTAKFEKRCSLQKSHGEKKGEIQGSGQEMAVMVG